MKVLALLACIISAISLSTAAVLFALRQDNQRAEQEEQRMRPPTASSQLLPEQHKAVDELLQEIIARTEELDRQKLRISERETNVREQEIILRRMRDEINASKEALEERFSGVEAEDRVNTRKLAEFYARMEPANAANLLMELNQIQAARILSNLQDRQAGAIFNAAAAMGDHGIERAATWSEEIRKIRNQ